MMTGMVWSLVAVLALIHLFAGALRFLDVIPRSRWLSTAGGMSVAYVFLHLLPELGAAGTLLAETLPGALHRAAYLAALLGLVLFYGLERHVKLSRHARPVTTGDGAMDGVFWLHIASFALYNLLIGYLLVQQRREPMELLLFGLAMGLHFLVNDYGLRHAHQGSYHRFGRWLLSTAIVAGAALATQIEVSETATSIFFAFLAGGVVLNMLKEELPEERLSRFSAFALGAAAYAALLLAL